MMEAIQWIMANYMVILEAVSAILGGAIVIALLIPGEQPEKFFRSVVDLIAKVSRK